MPYSWSETITNAVTEKASHIDELHNNSNTERARRGLGNYVWTNNITQYNNKVLNVDFTDIRTALDQAHTSNVCVSHYSSKDSTQMLTHYSTYNSSLYDSHLGSALSTNNSGQCPSWWGSHQTGVTCWSDYHTINFNYRTGQ